MINAFKIDWEKKWNIHLWRSEVSHGEGVISTAHLSSSVKPDSETALQKNPLNFEKV